MVRKMKLPFLRRIWNDESGIANVEFAFVLPVLITLLFGSFELSRYVLLNLKLEKATYTVSDLVTQETSISNSQLNQIMLAASEIMTPYSIGEKGTIIVSSVYQENDVDPPVVRWQYTGGGTLPKSSTVGEVDDWATLPEGLSLADKDNLIIAEIFYEFTPYFSNEPIGSASLHKMAFFKPRLGALTTTPN